MANSIGDLINLNFLKSTKRRDLKGAYCLCLLVRVLKFDYLFFNSFFVQSMDRGRSRGRGGGGRGRDGGSQPRGGRGNGLDKHPPRPGDWICPKCNRNNFASRKTCFRCDPDSPGQNGQSNNSPRIPGKSMLLG